MMKLKKILSLVLVVAMIASMLIVGAAAAETEEIQYPEAVAVMVGLGVIEGDEGGIRPTDTVTREEAAKIIAYALLGADTAETLKTATAPFADVAANRWSAGYIAYLKGQGIISGVTDTTFDPTADVTGIAFAKMMLTAVGYGKNGEFEGEAWDINTITLANQLGLYEGTKTADLAAAATREECMLYGFNTLAYIPTVSYNKTFESYYTGISALDPVDTAAELAKWTLGYKNYKLTKDTLNGTRDDFGRPAASWKADGMTIADTVSAAEPYAVVKGMLYSGNLYTTLGKTISEAYNKGNVTIDVYTDGAPLEDGDTYYPITADIKEGYYTNYVAFSGATSEFYVEYVPATGKYLVDIVVSYEHIGKVTKIDKAANEMTIDSATFKVDGKKIDISAYAKNDYVIYTEGDTAVASVRLADPVVGTYTAKNDTYAYYTIDGVPVYDSFVGTKGLASADFGTYNFYYDAQGNLLMVTEYDADAVSNSYQYLYVNSAEAAIANTSLLDGAGAEVAVEVYYANGGYAVLYYTMKYGSYSDGAGFGYYVTIDDVDFGLATTDNATTVENELTGKWFSYKIDDNGAVTLKDPKSDYAKDGAGLVLATGKVGTSVANVTTNSSTVLTIVDVIGTATKYVGYKNFPDLDTTDLDLNDDGANDVVYKVLVTYNKTTSTAKVAKTITVYKSVASMSAPVYAYVLGLVGTDVNGSTYSAWVDGGIQMILVDDATLTGGVYTWTVFAGINTLTPVADVLNQGHGYWTNWDAREYSYGESAYIDYVDEGFFTTGGVDTTDWADSVEKKIATKTSADAQDAIDALDSTDPDYTTDWAELTAIKGAADAILAAGKVDAQSYYYDANTVIYDAVNGGILTELPEGAVFCAVFNTETYMDYAAGTYCTAIWIVG